MNYELFIEVHTPVGVFGGCPHKGTVADADALHRLRNEMQAKGLVTLVLYSPDGGNNPREITFKESVLDRSVLIYTVRESLAPWETAGA